jgi:2-keto-4-pentenoate hydratase
VESRYASGHPQGDLEKIADVVSNGSVSYGPAADAWSWADVETLEMRLSVDGIEVAHHAGPHKSMPIAPLVEAWRDRCRRIGHLPRAGEVITLGSLTGLLPVPAAGGLILGECTGRGALEARVAPLGAS